MQSLFDRGEMKRKDLARLAYGIGKALEKHGEYEHEFDWIKWDVYIANHSGKAPKSSLNVLNV